MTVVRGVSADCKSGDSLDATPAANACNCLAPVASRFLSIPRMHWKTIERSTRHFSTPQHGRIGLRVRLRLRLLHVRRQHRHARIDRIASRTVHFTLTNTLPFTGVILTAFVSKLRRICSATNRQSCIRAPSDRLNKRGRVASSRR